MFGDCDSDTVTLDSVCKEIVDCPHSTPKYTGRNLDYPAIRTSELKSGAISWHTMRYVSKDEYLERTKRITPLPGDIVYAREGTYGEAAILPPGSDFCLGQRVMLFRPDTKKCTSEFLHQAIRSDYVKRQADSKNIGATVPHVNICDAKQFLIPLPPLHLQNQFADFVKQVDKSKSEVKQALEKLELLKDSLMQKYFG